MKFPKPHTIFQWFFLLAAVACTVILLISPKENVALQVNITNVEDCKNLSLFKTANCLVDYTLPFYKYRVTTAEESNTMTFEDLKANGGDCSDWSKLYVNLGKQFGFESKVLVFPINASTSHAIAVLSSKEGYCIIDEINVGCIPFVTDINSTNQK